MNFYDARETRDPMEREQDLLARLPAQIIEVTEIVLAEEFVDGGATRATESPPRAGFPFRAAGGTAMVTGRRFGTGRRHAAYGGSKVCFPAGSRGARRLTDRSR